MTLNMFDGFCLGVVVAGLACTALIAISRIHTMAVVDRYEQKMNSVLKASQKFVNYWHGNYPSNVQCEKVDGYVDAIEIAIADTNEFRK